MENQNTELMEQEVVTGEIVDEQERNGLSTGAAVLFGMGIATAGIMAINKGYKWYQNRKKNKAVDHNGEPVEAEIVDEDSDN